MKHPLDQLALPGIDEALPSASAAPRAIESFQPVPERHIVDITRVKRILGTSHSHVLLMIKKQYIAAFQMNGSGKWYIEYYSIVAFCDALRIKYLIRDRRPRRTGPRWRDEDLLPFPLSDTINSETTRQMLGITREVMIRLIDQGCFEAYHLFASSPWRISHSSLESYARTLGDLYLSAKKKAAAHTHDR